MVLRLLGRGSACGVCWGGVGGGGGLSWVGLQMGEEGVRGGGGWGSGVGVGVEGIGGKEVGGRGWVGKVGLGGRGEMICW